MPVDLIVCVATEMEGSLLQGRLPVLVTGVGAVNAASALTRFLSREGARAVISCGIGGAYPASQLKLADTVWASSECYGDLGAATPEGGFLDMRALGFALIKGPNPLYNTLPLQLRGAGRALPFVTVNTCTGSEAAAAALSARTGGCVETMEGAAIAHVARLFEIPAGNIRGISNPVGNRDRAVWRVPEAAAAAQHSLLAAWERGELTLPMDRADP